MATIFAIILAFFTVLWVIDVVAPSVGQRLFNWFDELGWQEYTFYDPSEGIEKTVRVNTWHADPDSTARVSGAHKAVQKPRKSQLSEDDVRDIMVWIVIVFVSIYALGSAAMVLTGALGS